MPAETIDDYCSRISAAKNILISNIKPHFIDNSWSETPGVVGRLDSVVSSLSHSDDLFSYIAPPILTLLDHHDPVNKTVGARLLNHLISTSTPHRLRDKNFHQVFAAALTDTSRWIDRPSLMLHSLNGLLELRKAYPFDTLEYYKYLENLMKECILRNYVYSINSESSKILVEYCAILIPLLGLHSFKFVNQILDIGCESLAVHTNPSISLLTNLIEHCWAGLHEVCGRIVVAIAECWRLKVGNKADLKELANLVSSIGGRNDFRALLDLDESCYSELASFLGVKDTCDK